MLHLADEDQAAIGLGLEKESRVRNGFGFGRRKLVYQLRMDIAGPGPAANVGDALVIYRNDRNAVGWLTRGAGTRKVVVATFQRAKKIR